MVDNSEITVKVAYGSSERQEVIAIEIPRDSTVKQAIQRSGILEKFREIELSNNQVGVYGKIVSLNYLLKDQDRIEIYRPLVVDPMQARRIRATQK